MASAPILLIDDHSLFRSGLGMIIQAYLPDMVIQEAGSMEEALRDEGGPPPVAILLDIQLPGVNGLQGLAPLRRRWPTTPVIMLSANDEPDVVNTAMTWGAQAFISKSAAPDRVIAAINTALRGDGAPGDGETRRGAGPSLSPRQSQVLDLLCMGLSNKAIAQKLGLSEFTVRGHVQILLRILGAESRSAAVFVARSRRLVG